MKEGFELRSCDWNSAFMAVLIVSLFEADRFTKKWGFKRSTIYFGGGKYFKIIFTLLIEMVAFHVRLTPIGFQGSSLKKLLLRLC